MKKSVIFHVFAHVWTVLIGVCVCVLHSVFFLIPRAVNQTRHSKTIAVYSVYSIHLFDADFGIIFWFSNVFNSQSDRRILSNYDDLYQPCRPASSK